MYSLFSLSTENMVGNNLYQKQISAINNRLPYFPQATDYTNSRLAALQQQLHITTTSVLQDHHASSNPWSSLIIPYQPLTSTLPDSKENLNEEDQRLTEEPQEVKKRNPYSIEELLKKPNKKPKCFDDTAFVQKHVQQPLGTMVEYCDHYDAENRKSFVSFSNNCSNDISDKDDAASDDVEIDISV